MSARIRLIALTSVLAMGASALVASSAVAQTAMQQCSVKYQAAKTAGTLGTQTWPGFLSQCRADLAATPAAATTPAVVAPAPVVVAPKPVVVAPKPAVVTAPVAPVAVAPGAAVFPTAISAAYASEKPGKQREKTCLDQYKANKATNSNGGLTWIMKKAADGTGGGYYSLCNKRLKGEA